MTVEHWNVLGLTPGASAAEVKQAYRRLAQQYHPDKTGDEASAAEFSRISSAYRHIMQATHTAAGPGVTKRRVRYPEISITLAEAYSGAEFLYRGTRIQLTPGIKCGDLVNIGGITVRVCVEPDPIFKRAGCDLLATVEIDAVTAMLGSALNLVCLDRSVLQYAVPAGIQHGQVIRICGKGMPDVHTGKYGDLLIQVHITIPTQLSYAQRQGLDKLFRQTTDLAADE